MSKNFFLLAFPRSGTNWLSYELSKAGAVVAIEPFSLHLPPKNPLRELGDDIWQSSMHQGQDSYKEDDPIVKDYLNHIKCIVQTETSIPIGIKEVAFGLKMGWLYQYITPHKIIYLRRDPIWIANSFAQNKFWTHWNYDERFDRASRLVQENEELQTLDNCLKMVDTTCWASKLTFLWILDVTLSTSILSLFDSVLQIQYEDLIAPVQETWSKLWEFLELPHLTIPSLAKEPRQLNDPYSTNRISLQKFTKKTPYLTATEITHIHDLLQHQPDSISMHFFQPANSTASLHHLATTKPAPVFVDEYHLRDTLHWHAVRLLPESNKPTWITPHYITNHQFVTFLNAVNKREVGKYTWYNYYAENAQIKWDDIGKQWQVNPSFEHYPVTNITFEAANAFASAIGGRLPTQYELTQLIESWDPIDSDVSLSQLANVNGTLGHTTSVYHYPPDRRGMHDIVGNVHEYIHNEQLPAFLASSLGAGHRTKSNQSDQLRPVIKWKSLSSHTTGFRVVFDQSWGNRTPHKKLLLLDFDGTLHNYWESASIALRQSAHFLIQQLILQSSDEATFYDAFRQSVQKEIASNSLSLRQCGWCNRINRLKEALRRLYGSQYELAWDICQQWLLVYEQTLQNNLELFPFIYEKLQLLQQGYEIIIVTEGPADAQKRALKTTGIKDVINGVFVSSDWGATKSDGSLFHVVMQQLERHPKDALMIGDSSRDEIGTRKVGIPFRYVNQDNVNIHHLLEELLSTLQKS